MIPVPDRRDHLRQLVTVSGEERGSSAEWPEPEAGILELVRGSGVDNATVGTDSDDQRIRAILHKRERAFHTRLVVRQGAALNFVGRSTASPPRNLIEFFGWRAAA